MKKIALISDIHGNLPALEATAADIEKRNIEVVFNLGDHLSGPLWPKETAEFLKKKNWFNILGNHDRQLYSVSPSKMIPSDICAFNQLDNSDIEWLKSLPPLVEIENTFLLFHGSPAEDTLYLLEKPANGIVVLKERDEILELLSGCNLPLIICGHSHIPRAVQMQNLLIVNPGSVGLQAYDDTSPEYHIVETGSPHARYSVIELREGEWNVENVLIEYDYDLSAKQAVKNNRPDWEKALLTGNLI